VPSCSELQQPLELTEYTAQPNYEKLYMALQQVLQNHTEIAVNAMAAECRNTLSLLEKCIADLQMFIADSDDALQRIKVTLRAPLA